MIYINGKPMPDLSEVQYIKVSLQFNWTRLKLKKVFIDIGQTNAYNYQITDEKGKNIQFSSDIDTINFMAKAGFELVFINKSNNQSGYLMKELYFKKGPNYNPN